MPPFIQLTITNNYFIIDPTPNIKSFLVPLLQNTSLVPALSVPVSFSKTPAYYYLPPTTPISLLPNSPTCSDIKQLNNKFSTFTKWLQSHYLIITNAFIKTESILIKEDYNFKLLKHALFNSNIGHTKLYRIGLIYRLINYITNYLKDFKID